MSDGSQPPERTELVYVPEPSWAPALVAAGLVAMAAGIWKGLIYVIVGAILFLLAARFWARDAAHSMGRLPREQRLTSAVLPAVPLKRPDES
jgi:hypothetical protein